MNLHLISSQIRSYDYVIVLIGTIIINIIIMFNYGILNTILNFFGLILPLYNIVNCINNILPIKDKLLKKTQVLSIIQWNLLISNYVLKLTNRYYKNKSLYNRIPNSKKIFNVLNKRLREYEDNNQGDQKIIHGDPVFTNILKTKTQIKFIDMRGKQGGDLSIYGDSLYDWAKIYQSLVGYDETLLDTMVDSSY